MKELLREGKEMDEIIDIFLSTEGGIPAILKSLSNVIDLNDESPLLTNRSCLWNKAKLFYKRGMADTSILKKNLVVSFSGEEGIDGGALRNEFFVAAIKKMNDDFFEGKDNRRLPKCHWGCEDELKIAGIFVAHSLLLGGPGFPCLHPAIYELISGGDAVEYQPTVQDIPVTAPTAELLEMISKVLTLWCMCSIGCWVLHGVHTNLTDSKKLDM